MFRKILFFICSLPKTIYFNFRYLRFRDAVHLPILIGADTIIGPVKGLISFDNVIHPFVIKFSWGGTNSRTTERKSYLSIGNKGSVIFHGKAVFARGVSLIADRGHICVGDHFFCNRNCSFSCNDSLLFSDDVLIGWNVEFLDSDNHIIYYDNVNNHSMEKAIEIGSHVWIGAFSHVLKGAKVPNGSVVAYNSLVTKPFFDEKVLLGGAPANIMKKNITWIR